MNVHFLFSENEREYKMYVHINTVLPLRKYKMYTRIAYLMSETIVGLIGLIKPLDTLINGASFLNRPFRVLTEYRDGFSSPLHPSATGSQD